MRQPRLKSRRSEGTPLCSTWVWAGSTALEIIASEASDKFDTPTLVKLWRTAPYLHDDAAATVRDLLTTRNPHDRHGRTSKLSHRQIEDLCACPLSL
jgi:hypothetical protein